MRKPIDNLKIFEDITFMMILWEFRRRSDSSEGMPTAEPMNKGFAYGRI